MTKVLCISDSLALPRDGVAYEETWLYKIKQQLPLDYIPLFQRFRNTDFLQNQNDSLLYYMPDIVVVQLGICDCAPRYVRTKSLLSLLGGKIPGFMQSAFWKIIKTIFKRNKRRTDVSVAKFKSNIQNYIDLCQKNHVKHIVFILIGVPSQKTVEHNPYILDNVEQYNKIILESVKNSAIACTIAPLADGNDNNYIDGYHCNDKGHSLVANRLYLVLCHLLLQNTNTIQ